MQTTQTSEANQRIETLRALFVRRPRRWLPISDATQAVSELRREGMGILERNLDGLAKFYYYDPKMSIVCELPDEK